MVAVLVWDAVILLLTKLAHAAGIEIIEGSVSTPFTPDRFSTSAWDPPATSSLFCYIQNFSRATLVTVVSMTRYLGM